MKIWSIEHNAYWKPNRCGYTKKIEEAGDYPLTEALSICANAGTTNGIPNEAVYPDEWAERKQS